MANAGRWGWAGIRMSGLAEARTQALQGRRQLATGVDPIDARRATPETSPVFTTCAARYIRVHRHSWHNAKHTRQWVRTLKTYARPVIGAKRVDAIETEDMLRILSSIWNTKTETAKRVQGRIENILDFAAAHHYCDPWHPARWRGHLDKLLPKPSRVKHVTHHPAMPHPEVAAFLRELSGTRSVSARALQFLMLTATRTSEVLQAQWVEIDRPGAVWTVPASRMKGRREHRVPLSDAALAVLDGLPHMPGNPYVFPGSPLWPPVVKHGPVATDATPGLWRCGGSRALCAAWIPVQFPGLVQRGVELSARGGGNGLGPRGGEQGGSGLPARRSVRQTSPDDAGVGRLPSAVTAWDTQHRRASTTSECLVQAGCGQRPVEKPPGYWKDPPTSLLPQNQVLPDLFWVEVFTVEGFFDRPRATDVQRLPHREDGAVMVREPSSLKNPENIGAVDGVKTADLLITNHHTGCPTRVQIRRCCTNQV